MPLTHPQCDEEENQTKKLRNYTLNNRKESPTMMLEILSSSDEDGN